eukprot:gene2067-18251_t
MTNAESSSSAPNAAAPLPPLPRLPAKEMAGPTSWSNWVIRGRVMAGAYPASLDDAETDQILTTLLELGVNTFVCLQAEVNIHCPESSWRNQRGLRPYIKDAQKLLGKAHETANPKIQQQKIDFLHLPIIDGNVMTDNAMHKLAEDCIQRVLQGENLYIHCWGGHGRTGTLVSVMLGRMYGLPYTAAMHYCQAFHDSRQYPQGVNSPHTPVQRAQALRPAVGAGPAARPQGAIRAAGSSAYGVGSCANGGAGSAHSGGAAGVGARVSPETASAATAVGSQPGEAPYREFQFAKIWNPPKKNAGSVDSCILKNPISDSTSAPYFKSFPFRFSSVLSPNSSHVHEAQGPSKSRRENCRDLESQQETSTSKLL